METTILRRLTAAAFCSVVFSAAPAAEAQTAGAQAAADPEAGRDKFYTCTGCHAIPGYTNAYPTYHVPRLGGQHAAYVIAALTAYKSGDRQHETMHANAATLDVQDMVDIAAYVSSFTTPDEPPPVRGDVEAGRRKSAPCAACHAEDGNSPVAQYPRLAGQYEDYLRKALRDYRSGARKNPIMNGMAANLSEQDRADLAAFYASQPNGLALIRN